MEREGKICGEKENYVERRRKIMWREEGTYVERASTVSIKNHTRSVQSAAVVLTSAWMTELLT